MSQNEVAAVGVIQGRYYQKIEAGRANPTAATLFALAQLFKTSVAALVDVAPTKAADRGGKAIAGPSVERRPAQRRRRWDVIAAAQERVADLMAERKNARKAAANKRRKRPAR